MRAITSDTFAYLANDAFQRAGTLCDTLIAHAAARWWGVELGVGCRFHGRPILYRFPNSRVTIGDSCVFRSAPRSNPAGLNRRCFISTLADRAQLVIGDSSGMSATVVAAAQSITLGHRVFCGANVTISDTDWHPLAAGPRFLSEPAETAPIVIHDDVWLCLNVLVLKGVTIGEGTVVGANSVVTKSLPAHVLAVGQPARPIRDLDAEERAAVLLPSQPTLARNRLG